MPDTKRLQGRRIGFVSTRFAGTDGVSLETAKWAEVLEGLGHTCFYFAGELDRPQERSRLVPEAQSEFVERYRQKLRVAYPALSDGRTLFPFRRVFMVARR